MCFFGGGPPCLQKTQPPPPPPRGSAHFCLLPIINFLPRLTMLTPKDIEGQLSVAMSSSDKSALMNGEILQVPAMDERQTLKQPHEPGYLVVLQYGDPGLMLPSVIYAEVFAPCCTKIVSPQTHRQPFEPPPLHTQTQAHPPPPPPTLALGLTPHTSTSSPSTRHHSCAEAYDSSQRYMNTLVVLSHHGAAASSDAFPWGAGHGTLR